MGYYTTYTLASSDSKLLEKEISELREKNESELCFLFKNKDGVYCGNSKWYTHEIDVATLSSKFPAVLFTLDGQGEDQGDVWRKFFLAGKVHIAQMTFENFDSDKLRPPQ